VLNGPTLNLLGKREPEIYGRTTLEEIGRMVSARARTHGLGVVFRQSNHEGVLIDWVQEARTSSAGVILNGGAFTHTSIALYDALRALDRPLIEVHLSNPHAREEFRRHSYVSLVANGVIVGLREQGYLLAVDALANLIKGATA
jgi:3-dehydroquinate dehydratase-2